MDGRKILTVGVAYRPVRGGIASVESVYSTFYNPFNHIATAPAGSSSKVRKLFQFGSALFQFLWWMLFHPEIQIVHVHVASQASFWWKRIIINLAKAFRKIVVFHLHGGLFQEFYAHHQQVVQDTIDKCDCVITLSDYWRHWVETTFDCPKVVTINKVIESPKLNKVPHGMFTLLFLGLLAEDKGIYDLLDVIARHKTEFAGRLQLLIGGNGDAERVKNFIAQQNLQGG